MAERPIDQSRDAAFSMDVGDATDTSHLMEMVPMAGRMLMIKEHSIWQVRLADDVDPDRTNPGIPHSQQKLLSRGTSDPLVCRTLLQAKRLLQKDFLPSTCDAAEGLRASLSFLQDISAVQDKADEHRLLTERLKKDFQGAVLRGQGLNVPTAGDVSAQGKAFIQAADHAVRSLWQMVRTLEPNLPVGVSWQRLTALLEARDASETAKMVEHLATGFIFLRNTRNAVEHPKPGQEVIFQDYRLKEDGKVHPPAVTVIEENTPLAETELGSYFEFVVTFLVNAFEAMLVHLCSINVQPFGAFDIVVTKLEPDRRRYDHVAYGYASWMGNQLVLHLD